MIYHVYTHYSPRDPDTARRHRIAQSTWPRQPWKDLPIRDEDLPRMFRDNGRDVPYVRDVFDFATEGKKEDDILIYTNADIMVRGDCCAQVAALLVHSDAGYCYRRDFHHRVDSPVPDKDFEKGLDYAGSDLFALRVLWWRVYRLDMPDMLIGSEAWDPVLRKLIDETNPTDTLLRNLICHERHGSYWENPKHRYTLASQKYNLALAKAFFMSRNINPANYAIR